MVTEELPDPALADPVEDQQRAAVEPVHNHGAGFLARADLSEPAAPGGFVIGVARQAGQIGGDGVAAAGHVHVGGVGCVEDIAAGLARQDAG